MQNKANLLDAQMNVTSSITKHYENDNTFRLPENKPNSNPIQTQSNPIKANIKPKQTQNKPNQTQPVVSLPALSLPVVSLPALSLVEVSNQSKGSNLFHPHRLWACFNFLLGMSYRENYVL